MNRNKSPQEITRRKFLLYASALTPATAILALKGNIIGNVALAQDATPAATSIMLDCVASPDMTEGPYFVDEMLNRSDIRIDPSNNKVSLGVPLALTIGVFSVDGVTCTPLKNAYVDIWHCDATGLYSDEQSNNTVGQKFLRGYQVTNDMGEVNFTTVYPGWYRGRTVHIHMKVRTFSSDATPSAATPEAIENAGTTTYDFTSQLFFDDNLSDQVFTLAPYNERGVRTTRNNNDGIFGVDVAATAGIDAHDAGEQMMLNLVKDGDGYTGRINVGVDLSKQSTSSNG
jgi:protocatechuate 3,4-dioxygenase beta subunit